MCNYTSNFTNFSECSTTTAGATIISPVLMSLTGVLGNILALYQLYKARTDVRTTKFYSLVAGLAWTDLLGILMTSPSVILAYVNRRQWVGGDAHCRFHGFIMVTFGLATPLIICAMAVERFLALMCVFFYSSRCRTGTARGCILILWFGAILYGLLPLFGFGKFEKQYPGTWCYLDFHSENIISNVYGYVYACTNLSLIMVIFLCNAYVMIIIFKTRFKRDRSEGVYALSNHLPEHDGLMKVRTMRRKSNDADIQMIVLLCAITVVFTVCWAPLMQDSEVINDDERSNVGFPNAKNNASVLRHHVTNSDEERARATGKNISPPDVTQKAAGDNRSPHPDITNTAKNKDAGYVCHFKFGKSVSPKQERGMYVKVLYLQNNAPVLTNVAKHPDRSLICYQGNKKHITNNSNIPISAQLNNTDTPGNCSAFHTKSSETSTKETSVSPDIDFHSEAPKEPACTTLVHESLRKTKSSN